MKHWIGLSAATVLFAASPAFAADVISAAEAPPVAIQEAPVFSWSGLYVGAQVGPVWGRHDETEFDDAAGATGFEADFNSNGWLGGAYVGYGWQWSNIYLGAEADIVATTLDDGYRTGGDGTDVDLNWEGSLRARLGYAADRLLFYGTAGVSFADIDYRFVNGTSGVTESFSDSATGWTVGAGVDWAMTDHLIARVEYRYSDFGTTNLDSDTSFPGFNYDEESRFHTLRIGAAYKF